MVEEDDASEIGAFIQMDPKVHAGHSHTKMSWHANNAELGRCLATGHESCREPGDDFNQYKQTGNLFVSASKE